MSYTFSPGTLPSHWAYCAECGCAQRREWMTARPDGAVYCSDVAWCVRARRVRQEVEAEFAALHAVTEEERDTHADLARDAALERKRAAVAATRKPSPPSSGACAECGKPWTKESRGRSKKYCSPRCRVNAGSKKARAARKRA